MMLELPKMGARRMQFFYLVPPSIVEVTSDGSGLEGSTVDGLKDAETYDTIIEGSLEVKLPTIW
jgi:uncharacterized protein YjiK